MGSLIGPIAGNAAFQGSAGEAQGNLNQGLAQYQGINVPSIEEQQLNLALPQLAGTYNPETVNALQQGNTQLSGIQTDPRLVQSQMQALQSLSQIGQSGLTPADMAALQQATNAAGAQNQAQQAQILQNMAARGMGGSGAELAARLSGSQNAANQLNANANNIAQEAQNRALQAINQQGSLAGNIQQQQYGEAANAARAQDVINQFNTQNKQNIMNQNAGTLNQAQLANLQAKQNVMNAQNALQNQQQQYNKGLYQQQFQNQMQKAGGESGIYGNKANMQYNTGLQTNQNYQNIGKGFDSAIGSMIGLSDENAKEDIKETSNPSHDFLDKLKNYAYSYKDKERDGEGQHSGIMAQDLEKAGPIGKSMVEHTLEGKKVNYAKGFGTILGNQADMHKRLKKLEEE